MVVRAKDVLGRRGEDLATQLLLHQGYAVLDRNWRCDIGEIDVVARDGDELVLCEVKTRTSTMFGTPLEAVDWRKVQRLHRLGQRWLAGHDAHPVVVRVDVVAVLIPRFGRPSLEHLRNIS
jgi:putative endonuclease